MINKKIFQTIRASHLAFAKDKLPDNIALYFHNLEKDQIKPFIDVLKYFNNQGYKVVDPITYGQCEGKNLFLSFDDNYYNWLNIAEILSKNNYKAVFYTNTCPIKDITSASIIDAYFDRIKYYNDKRTLSIKNIQVMHQDYKQIIGGHTVNHYNLNKLPINEAFIEILKNKKELEDIVGEKINHFSYPFGMRRYFNPLLREYCIQIGYETISNAIPGLLYKKFNQFDINRTMWNFEKCFQYNIENIRINGNLFEKITGKSPIG